MEWLKLSNQVCFPLYALSRKITAQYQPLLEPLDLTYPQYLVLMLLWEHKELSVKELGEQLMLDSGTLTPLLKRLEQKNFVSRARSAGDERVVLVTLTDAGKKLKRKAAQVPEKFACSLPLSHKEMIHLRELATDLLARMEAAEKNDTIINNR